MSSRYRSWAIAKVWALLAWLSLGCQTASAESNDPWITATRRPAQVSVLRSPFAGTLLQRARTGAAVTAADTVIANVRSEDLERTLQSLRRDRSALIEAQQWAYGVASVPSESFALGTSPPDGDRSVCAGHVKLEPRSFTDAFGRSFQVNDSVLLEMSIKVATINDIRAVCDSMVDHWTRVLESGPTVKDEIFLRRIKAFPTTKAASFRSCAKQPDEAVGLGITILLERCQTALPQAIEKEAAHFQTEETVLGVIDKRYKGEDTFPKLEFVINEARRALPDVDEEALNLLLTRSIIDWTVVAGWSTRDCTAQYNQEMIHRYETYKARGDYNAPYPNPAVISWCHGDRQRMAVLLREFRAQRRRLTFPLSGAMSIVTTKLYEPDPSLLLASAPDRTNSHAAELSGTYAELSRQIATMWSLDPVAPYWDGSDTPKLMAEMAKLRMQFMLDVAQYQAQWRREAVLLSQQLKQLETYYANGDLVSPYDGKLLQTYKRSGAAVGVGDALASLQHLESTLAIRAEEAVHLPYATMLPVWICGLDGRNVSTGFFTHSPDASLLTVAKAPAIKQGSVPIQVHLSAPTSCGAPP